MSILSKSLTALSATALLPAALMFAQYPQPSVLKAAVADDSAPQQKKGAPAGAGSGEVDRIIEEGMQRSQVMQTLSSCLM